MTKRELEIELEQLRYDISDQQELIDDSASVWSNDADILTEFEADEIAYIEKYQHTYGMAEYEKLSKRIDIKNFYRRSDEDFDTLRNKKIAQMIICVDSQKLFDKVLEDKAVSLAVMLRGKAKANIITNNDYDADVYLYESKPSEKRIERHKACKQSYWYIGDDGKWHGHDYIRDLESMENKELFAMAVAKPETAYAASLILTCRHLVDNSVEKIKDERGYLLKTVINGVEIRAVSSDKALLTDKRKLAIAYINYVRDMCDIH